MKFTNRLVNRETFPTKHVLVCEDNLAAQSDLANRLITLFGSCGLVQASFAPGAAQAAGILSHVGAELIILDHDMPFGNGIEFIEWMKAAGHHPTIPIVTFSGIDANNDALMAAGAHYKFKKNEVINGQADEIIRRVLGL